MPKAPLLPLGKFTLAFAVIQADWKSMRAFMAKTVVLSCVLNRKTALLEYVALSEEFHPVPQDTDEKDLPWYSANAAPMTDPATQQILGYQYFFTPETALQVDHPGFQADEQTRNRLKKYFGDGQ